MSQKRQTLVRGSTNILDLTKAKNEITGLYPVDLECTLTLNDSNDVAVDGVEDQAMEYVEGTTGKGTTYRYALPATVSLPDDTYTAVIVASTPGGVQRTYNIGCDVVDG